MFGTYEFSKFAIFTRIIHLLYSTQNLVHGLTYFHLSDLYEIWHTAFLYSSTLVFFNKIQICKFLAEFSTYEIWRDLALFHDTRYILVQGYTHFLCFDIVRIWHTASLIMKMIAPNSLLRKNKEAEGAEEEEAGDRRKAGQTGFPGVLDARNRKKHGLWCAVPLHRKGRGG